MSGLVCGSLGASRIADATARLASGKGWGATRKNIMAELISERLTGVSYETYKNADMIRGLEVEPMARASYAFEKMCEVIQTEPIPHPTIKGAHASPDGLVGEDGLVEIKCPRTSTHLETLLSDDFDGSYVKQMQWQMAVTGRKWCDFVSFDPRLPTSMQLYVSRVARDDILIRALEKDVVEFLTELDAKVAELRKRFNEADAA